MRDADVLPLEVARTSKRHSFEVAQRVEADAASGGGAATGGGAGPSADGEAPSARRVDGPEAGPIEGGVLHLALAADSREDMDTWLTFLAAAAVPSDWPGNYGMDKRPAPFLYSRVERKATQMALRAMREGRTEAEVLPLREELERRESPVVRYPALKTVPTWQQRALLLRKLRLCSISFDTPDPATAGPHGPHGPSVEDSGVAPTVAAPTVGPTGLAALSRTSLEARDIKRQTLLELVDFCDSSKNAFTEFRVLDDTFNMIRTNLFRALPTAPEPSGDPDEEEEPFMDPQWSHLAVVYEFLLHLVSLDHIDLTHKKRVIDPSFVRSILALFDSEDMRERDYLKTITHRIYSKLTQRRALIRRVICNIFFEFVYETQRHNGIAEMLEILASIINGFAVPIKDEHKVMLTRALLPLHKPPTVMIYHAQLSYCMALYVAKDHTLTRLIIPGLLKFWPFGASNKQIMFLNELDDVFEYVQEDDMPHFRRQLGQRLAKALGGLHFQVAERTLCLWHSERFSALVLEDPESRADLLPMVFAALYKNAQSHWHEAVRTLSAHILEQYSEADPKLYERCLASLPEEARSDDGGGLGVIAKRPSELERSRLQAELGSA